jgi:hypothetical protein
MGEVGNQGQVQLGLGYLARTSIIAWNLGVDLFGEADNHIALGYEYAASLLLGEKVHAYRKIVDTRSCFSDIYEGALIRLKSRVSSVLVGYSRTAFPASGSFWASSIFNNFLRINT